MSLWEIKASRNVAAVIISQTSKTVSLVVTFLKRVGKVEVPTSVPCVYLALHT